MKICKNILYEVNYKKTGNVKVKISLLKAKEIAALKYAANSTLNNLLVRISSDYPKIDNDDLTFICLLLLDISINDISELLGKTYHSAWRRVSKIKLILNHNTETNLHSFLLNFI